MHCRKMYKMTFYHSCKFSDGILIDGLKTKGLEILDMDLLDMKPKCWGSTGMNIGECM